MIVININSNNPQWHRLADPRVWIDAATQIFFSLSLGFGALVAFASFMPYKNDITKDSILVAIINCMTSVSNSQILESNS